MFDVNALRGMFSTHICYTWSHSRIEIQSFSSDEYCLIVCYFDHSAICFLVFHFTCSFSRKGFSEISFWIWAFIPAGMTHAKDFSSWNPFLQHECFNTHLFHITSMFLNNFFVLFMFYSMPSILHQRELINWMFIHHRVTCIYSKCKHTLQSTSAFLDVSLFWATLFSECSVWFVALSPVTIKPKLNHSHTNHSS